MPVELADHDGSGPLLDTPPDDVVGERVEVAGVASRRFRFDFRKTSSENHAKAE